MKQIKVAFYQNPDIIHCKHHGPDVASNEPSAGLVK